MELLKKIEPKNALRDVYGVPVSKDMKSSIDKLKLEKNIDVNAMTRDFLSKVIRLASGEATT